MSVFYLDTSAWVKRYVQEAGSSWIHRLFNGRERLLCNNLGYVEAVAALSRRAPESNLDQLISRLQLDWQEMTQLSIDSPQFEQAGHLALQYRLRGADAVHLASVLHLQTILAEVEQSVVLVTSDSELFAAAQTAGLSVEDPIRAARPA